MLSIADVMIITTEFLNFRAVCRRAFEEKNDESLEGEEMKLMSEPKRCPSCNSLMRIIHARGFFTLIPEYECTKCFKTYEGEES